jgi:hypothetical protein
MKREARLQGILRISRKPHPLGSPVKEPSLKVPFIQSLVGNVIKVSMWKSSQGQVFGCYFMGVHNEQTNAK